MRKIGIGLAAALAAGLVLGAVARLMMRLATLAAGHAGEFSLGGTMGIVTMFVMVAVPGAVLASLLTRRGRSALLVLGALLLCVPATGVAAADLGDLTGLSTLQWVGVIAATAGVYAAILGLPVLTLRLVALGQRAPAQAAVQQSPVLGT